jgi:cytochrome P450
MDVAPPRRRSSVTYDVHAGQWFVFGYDDVRSLLVDARLTPDRMATFRRGASAQAVAAVQARAAWLLHPSGTDYEWIGPIVRAGLRDRGGATFKRAVAEACDELLDDLLERPSFDVVNEYAFALSARMVAHFLGVSDRDGRELLEHGLDLVAFFSGIEISVDGADRMARSVSAIVDRCMALVEARDVQHGFLSAAQRSAAAHGRAVDEEAVATITLPLVTGHVDAAHLVAMTVWLLLEHPGERARLAADERLLAGAVSEALRFGSPVALVPRTTLEPIALRGHHVERGARMQLSLAMANRDPTRFPDPDRFDITRPPSGALGFGYGARACIASGVARLLAATAVSTLVGRGLGVTVAAKAGARWRPVRGINAVQALELHVALPHASEAREVKT